MDKTEVEARYHCTKLDPWTPDKGKRVEHEDAYETGESADCESVYMTCPNCKHEWREELGA